MRASILASACVLALAACNREERRFTEAPPTVTAEGAVQLSTLEPGVARAPLSVHNRYESNAWAIAEGQRLYNWMNCVGCHANGGGGMGPALMDDAWIYGAAPENIFQTITQGRPNGMPAFQGRLSDQQVWQLVAYVRSLSGLTPKSAVSSRADGMHITSAPTVARAEKPKQTGIPGAAEMP